MLYWKIVFWFLIGAALVCQSLSLLDRTIDPRRPLKLAVAGGMLFIFSIIVLAGPLDGAL